MSIFATNSGTALMLKTRQLRLLEKLTQEG